MEKSRFIDIDKVIASKSAGLQKRLPRFVVNYLKRLVHQDEINVVIEKYGATQGVEFVGNVLNELNVRYTSEGLENIADNERYIFASNHPLGGLDGMVLIHLLGSKFGDIKFPVNDFLMHIHQMHNVFIPVNKLGSQSADSMRKLDEAYASSAQLLNFPAGLCSRKQHGVVQDLEWKKSFITKAIKHERSVVPVYFDGRNSTFFYNLAKLRKFLGVKFNVEMLFLVDEMFKQRGKRIHVIVGKPIHYSVFDGSKTHQEWATWVKNRAYELCK